MKKIIIIIILLFITGCSYKELNDLALANALGVDYLDNKYKITVQVLNLKKSGETEEESSVIYEAHGETIVNAIRNISLSYPKRLYLGHLELIVFGNSILEQDIDELLDFFIRSPETRNDFDILINPSGTARSILSPAIGKANSFPSKEILNTIENSMERQGTTVKINMEEFINTYLEKGIIPVTTTIEKIDNENTLTGIIAITDDKKIIKLNTKQAIAYNSLNENFNDIVVTTSYKDKLIDLIIGNPKSDIDINIDNNKINITIDINFFSQASNVRNKINLENTKVQKEIQKNINKTIKEYIESLIDLCKENNADIIGLKNIIYKYHFKNYSEFKDKNIYEIADIKININTKLYRYGNLYRSTKGE